MAEHDADRSIEDLKRKLDCAESKLKVVEGKLDSLESAARREIDDLISDRAKLIGELNQLSIAAARKTAQATEIFQAFLDFKSSQQHLNQIYPFQQQSEVSTEGRYLSSREAQLERQRAAIVGSDLFDIRWYLSQNRDILWAKIDPILHYIEYGAAEGRDPNPLFATSWYQQQNPDVAEAGLNPLVHYIEFGEREGRIPCPDVEPEELQDLGALNEGSPLALSILLKKTPETKLVALTAAARALAPPAVVQTVAKGVAFAAFQPTISLILPTYNSKSRYLREAIESVIHQSYRKWQLCIVDDGSTDKSCLEVLRSYSDTDARIQIAFSAKNGGIADASNTGLAMASGEYVGFIDHDDVLAQDALHEVVEFLSDARGTDFVYTDHAVIDHSSRFLHQAHKPAWSPELFLATNYIVHFKVVKTELMRRIGGFRASTSVIQDLDVSLRLYEAGARILHLPKILYFWRKHEASVASGTSAKPAIEKLALKIYDEHLLRLNLQVRSEWPIAFQQMRVGCYKLRFPAVLANRCEIVVLCKARDPDLVRLENIARRADAALHVIMLGPLGHALTSTGETRVSRVANQSEFNAAILDTRAENIIFIRPDAHPMTPDWLRELVGYLDLNDEIGAVGGKVLDDRLAVKAGGTVLLDTPMTMDRGVSDYRDGYWFTNKIASNVEGVSSVLLATRTEVLRKLDGLPVFEFSDAAGLAFCLALRKLQLRVVYNPWSMIVDRNGLVIPDNIMDLLRRRFEPESMCDRYYNPNFSRVYPHVACIPRKIA